MPRRLTVLLGFGAILLTTIVARYYQQDLRNIYQQLSSTGQIVWPIQNESPARELAPIPVPNTRPAPLAVKTETLLQATQRKVGTAPEATLEWLQSMETSAEQEEAILQAISAWTLEDSENALLWLETNTQGNTRLENLNHAIELWAKNSPEAAARWIQGMANDGSKQTAAAALTQIWGATAPVEAAAWIENLSNTPTRDEAASRLVQVWAQSDPEAAARWALAEAEFGGNRNLLDESVIALTKADPTKAETWVRSLAEAFDQPEGLEAYLRTRTEIDPLGTMTEIASLAETDPIQQETNPTVIMETWSRIDSVSASQWLSGQSPGPLRDAAISGFVRTIRDYEPMAAAEWSIATANPELQSQNLHTTFESWGFTNPNDALDWLQSSNLPTALRQSLMTKLPTQ